MQNSAGRETRDNCPSSGKPIPQPIIGVHEIASLRASLSICHCSADQTWDFYLKYFSLFLLFFFLESMPVIALLILTILSFYLHQGMQQD